MTDLRRTPLRRLLLLSALMGGASLVEDTATGNPVTFETDVAKPLVTLEIPFTPVQSGTGDPSPQNVRPIVPWNGLNVKHGGKNILNPAYFAESSEFYSVDNGIITAKKSDYRSWSSLPKIFLRAGTYTISKSTAEGLMVVRSSLNDYSSSVVYAEGVASGKFTLSADAYIAIKPSENMSYPATFTLQLEAGQTATAYEPYKPITETDISFPSPVYGGTLDVVSGVLTVTHEGLVSTWGQAKVDRKQSGYQQGRMFFTHDVPVSGQSGASATYQKCNIAKYQWDDFNGTPHFYTCTIEGRNCAVILIPEDTPDETEIVVSAKLKTTYEVQLTGEQITALVGDNTIWSDADGSMTAVYLKKG